MSRHADPIRLQLSRGPLASRQLFEKIGVSQPTGSRALKALGSEVVRFGSGRAIHYALRDEARGLADIAIYRVDVEGQIRRLGMLIPVRPEGFVMRQENGAAHHSDGLPWWLLDMRPQGYLGRAYAVRYGAELGLPGSLSDWTDTHALRALLVHGHDVVGNLLLGEMARERFLSAPPPTPVPMAEKAGHYVQLAAEAARGDTPGSSAGGEQPKFTTFAETPDGPRHVIVKFTEPVDGLVSERWSDLLLAEHLALETLREAGVAAARTRVIDHGQQRFLEVERFDRVGAAGRRAIISLGAFDAEFVGSGRGRWPIVVRRLSASGEIRPEAADEADLLWAFGALIGNTDMHLYNLSFVSDHGRPYGIAPAYDMSPMCFAPRSGGGMADTIQKATIHSDVSNETWRRAGQLARDFLARIQRQSVFSHRFDPCLHSLTQHIEAASVQIAKLG